MYAVYGIIKRVCVEAVVEGRPPETRPVRTPLRLDPHAGAYPCRRPSSIPYLTIMVMPHRFCTPHTIPQLRSHRLRAVELQPHRSIPRQ